MYHGAPGQGNTQIVNPIFHVPNANPGQGNTLPPFSQIAAAVDVQPVDNKGVPMSSHQMLYTQSRSPGHMSQG
jgi:meiosis induction protein kinase IME2/SME1